MKHRYRIAENSIRGDIMMYAKDFRAAARSALSDTWGQAVLVTFLMMLFSAIGGSLIVGLVVLPVITWSFTIMFLALIRGKKVEVSGLFVGFNYFGKVWCLEFLTGLFVFLWSLLLIVPGLIKVFSYAMAPYILAENPNMRAVEAITESRRIMDGNKWRFFCLNFSFIGWAILATLTLGIGYLWLTPYILTANARFYDEVKREKREPEAFTSAV